MKEQHIPGLAVVVVDGQHVLWQQAFGTTDGSGSRPVTVDTLLQRAVDVQGLHGDGRDAGRAGRAPPTSTCRSRTYLPGFTVHSAFESHPERKITLRMLLGHTAGFTHEAPLGNNYEPSRARSTRMSAPSPTPGCASPVGTGYAYSNLGIDLAAYILEQAEGRAVPGRHARLPAGAAGHEPQHVRPGPGTRRQDRAVGHSDSFVADPVDIPMTGAGGLWTSAADLAEFLAVPARRRHRRRSHRPRPGAYGGDAHCSGARRRRGAPATPSASSARGSGRRPLTWTCSVTAAEGSASCRT